MSSLISRFKDDASLVRELDSSTTTNTTSSTRIVLLDIIRILSIGLLLTAHTAGVFRHPLGGFFGIENFYWVTLGGVAVTLFFILSGLALELKYGAKQIRYRDFVVRRVLRIYPVYSLCLILGIVIYISEHHAIVLHWYDVFLSITGFYAFAGRWGGPFVATSWFIGPLLFMYFVYPMLSRYMAKYNKAVLLIVLLIISTAFRLLVGNGVLTLPVRPLDWFPLCRVFEFGLGIYIAQAFRDRAVFRFKFRHAAVNNLLATLGIASFPLFLVHYTLISVITNLVKTGVGIPAAVTIYAILATFLAWAIAVMDRRIQSALKPVKAALRSEEKAARSIYEPPSATVILNR
jgi:peptidoglycan/LPS O-acetylase OafA/YrhL